MSTRSALSEAIKMGGTPPAEVVETPAVFANKMYFSVYGPGARVTFAEAGASGGASARAAVFLLKEDIKILHKVLGQIIEQDLKDKN